MTRKKPQPPARRATRAAKSQSTSTTTLAPRPAKVLVDVDERNARRLEKFERVFEQIYRFVLRIPPGRVMTYGQIARLLDDRYSPRLVGWAMHATPKDARNIPWHRVINSRGATSTGKIILHEPDLQRLLLESEGVVFNDRGTCDLSIYQWEPKTRKAPAKAAAAKRSAVASKTATTKKAAKKTAEKSTNKAAPKTVKKTSPQPGKKTGKKS